MWPTIGCGRKPTTLTSSPIAKIAEDPWDKATKTLRLKNDDKTCWQVLNDLNIDLANKSATERPGSYTSDEVQRIHQFHPLDKPEVDWLIQVFPGVFAQALNVTRVYLVKAIRNREAQIRSE